MGKSRITGANNFRKLLRQLPDSARGTMADVLEGFGREMVDDMRADAPTLKVYRRDRTAGALRAGISMKLSKKTLRLRVGLVGSPKARAKLFYGRIIENGRKAQTVTAKRRWGRRYSLKVGAVPARPFVFKRRSEQRERLRAWLKNYWTDVLTDAARGSD